MIRYARPLTVTTRIDFVNRLSAPGLRLWRWPRAPRKFDVELVAADQLPSDIDAVDEATAGRIGTAVVRDRVYLHWRFGRNPLARSEVLVARDGGHPVGFLVFTMKDQVGLVKDWLTVTETVRLELFAALLDELRDRRATSAFVIALETHPDLAALRSLGFIRRPEISAVVTYAAMSNPARDALTDSARWYMTVGDRDI